MVQDFFDRHIFLYIMGGLCGLGVILKCFLLIIYNKLISSSENMAHTKRNWLKTMKLRFESSYQLQLGVNDVDTYVDKYVSKLKCGGLLLSTWENISGQTIGLCLLTGSFAGIIGFIYKCGQGPVLFTFFTGAWTAIIVNIVDNIVNISAHRQMLRYNLIDYFENNLKARMEQEVFHPEARRKYQREYFSEDAEMGSHTEDADLIQSKLKSRKATAATVESQEEVAAVHNQNNQPISKDISRKERRVLRKQAKKQAKLDKKQARKEVKIAKKEAKRAKKQSKYDAMEAKKKEKVDAIEAKKQKKIEAVETKKQEKNASNEAKKHLKQHSKQEIIDNKKLKKLRREESREAKERAEIETIKSKKQAREEAKEKRIQIEKERKEKELHGNKAYREKMRLKEEKEREAVMREQENNKIKDSNKKEANKKEDIDSTKSNERSHNEINESLTKQRLRGAVRNISKEQVQATQLDDLADEELMELQGEEEKESFEMTATSKEEDMLIEEVLKDFLF